MARRPKRGRCVHCLADNVERTWDHTFPKAWYPDTTPSNLEKWKIPACRPCNEGYGKLEEDLLLALSLCVDPHMAASAGIAERTLRSLRPEYAKNERDARARGAKRDQLLSRLIHGEDIPRSALYPGLGDRSGMPLSEAIGVPLPAKSCSLLAAKIVRGIHYLDDQMFIEPSHRILVWVQTEEGAKPLKDVVDRIGKHYARGPGILVKRAVPQDDPMSGMFEIRIWDQFIQYAAVEPVD